MRPVNSPMERNLPIILPPSDLFTRPQVKALLDGAGRVTSRPLDAQMLCGAQRRQQSGQSQLTFKRLLCLDCPERLPGWAADARGGARCPACPRCWPTLASSPVALGEMRGDFCQVHTVQFCTVHGCRANGELWGAVAAPALACRRQGRGAHPIAMVDKSPEVSLGWLKIGRGSC